MKFTKSYLQTLSTDALLQIAESQGFFLSADITRRLIIGELLDNQEMDSDQDSVDPDETAAQSDTITLPQSYNVTQIQVLLRNPMWFFAFWDFHECLFTKLTNAKNFSHFFLRIHALKSTTASESSEYASAPCSEVCCTQKVLQPTLDEDRKVINPLRGSINMCSFDHFDVEIPNHERKRYVYIAFDAHFHRTDLMVCFNDGSEQLLAQSNIIEMHRTIIPQRLCISQNNTNKIMSLSGLLSLKKSHFQNYRQAF
ncbi:MAG: DUF4912 domain-containing protein [Treponema sp.]